MYAAVLALVLASGAAPAGAAVYQSTQAALAEVFAGADRIETRNLVLSDVETREVEREARARLGERIVTVHVGHLSGEVMGYAFIDVHPVRTLPEALLVLLGPAGDVRQVRVLAFHEPTEYKPRESWFHQFDGRTRQSELRLARDIHGVAGATLSSRAVLSSVRRALALHRVLIESSDDPG